MDNEQRKHQTWICDYHPFEWLINSGIHQRVFCSQRNASSTNHRGWSIYSSAVEWNEVGSSAGLIPAHTRGRANGRAKETRATQAVRGARGCPPQASQGDCNIY